MSFELVRLWRCGACQGLRERQEAEAVRRLCGAILEAVAGVSRFHDRDARAGSRPRASRFRGSGALAVVCGISRAIRADRDAKIEPSARKMTDARRSHLMHSMTQGFILSDSQKGIALMRRGLRV